MKNKLFITLIAVFAFIQINAQTTASSDVNPRTAIIATQIPSLSDQNINTDEVEAEPVIEISTETVKPQVNCKMNERTMESDCKQNITNQKQTNGNGVQSCKNCSH